MPVFESCYSERLQPLINNRNSGNPRVWNPFLPVWILKIRNTMKEVTRNK